MSEKEQTIERGESLPLESDQWRILYDNLPGGSFVVNDQYLIQDVNQVLCEITGYGRDELIGQRCGIICPKGPHKCPIFDMGKPRIENDETAVKDRNGIHVPIIKCARRVTFEDHDVIVENFQEITQLKQAQAELKQSQAELEQCIVVRTQELTEANIRLKKEIEEHQKAELENQHLRERLCHITRIATMSEFSASLAHELSQPLTAIQCSAQSAESLLSREKPDLQEIRDIIQDIIAGNRHATEVIAHLRSLFEKGHFQSQAVNLNALVCEVVRLLTGDMATKGISLSTIYAPDMKPVCVDTVQVQQVILNLLSNAIEAVNHPEVETRKIAIQTILKEQEAWVKIGDSGKGIDPAIEKRLFEPFVTTRSNGMGMGLSICSSILEAHGGRIWVQKNRAYGACFCFALPVIKEDDQDDKGSGQG